MVCATLNRFYCSDPRPAPPPIRVDVQDAAPDPSVAVATRDLDLAPPWSAHRFSIEPLDAFDCFGVGRNEVSVGGPFGINQPVPQAFFGHGDTPFTIFKNSHRFAR